MKGDLKIVSLLLEHKADVNLYSLVSAVGDPRSFLPPLTSAVRSNDEEIVNLLLHHGAEVDIEGEVGTALQHAVSGGNPKIVSLLLEHKANVNHRSHIMEYRHHPVSTPLEFAVKFLHEEIVDMLLQHGAHVGAEVWNIVWAHPDWLNHDDLIIKEKIIDLLSKYDANSSSRENANSESQLAANDVSFQALAK